MSIHAPTDWPASGDELVQSQLALAAEPWTPWRPLGRFRVGACYVCFEQAVPGRGRAEDTGWAAASLGEDTAVVTAVSLEGYGAGLLALREGPMLEAAVRGLQERPDVLLVDATGRDHPRRAGLALQLGAVLGLPTVGITDRSFLAQGDLPPNERGAASPLVYQGERVGYWLRTRPGSRPVAVHAAWRTGPEVAVEVVLTATGRMRTPEPMRVARTAARAARAAVRGR